MCCISRTVSHVIMIFGPLVLNDNISRCFFHFFELSSFWAVKRVKGQKIVENEKQQMHPSRAVSPEQHTSVN